MLLHDLERKELIHPPSWIPDNTMYLYIGGSISYGISEDYSDFDLSGYAIPPKREVFPEHINGFDAPLEPVKAWHKTDILDKSALKGKGREYDLTIYPITRYFKLLSESNPNIIDSLFVSQEHILHSTAVSELVRDNRHLFLSKEIWPRFKGYAYSQLKKSNTKTPEEGSKRAKIREEYGCDVKFLYNIIRLLSEAEQILATGDLDLQEEGRREQMKAIRRGEVPEEEIKKWASAKEKQLETLYHNSTLPWKADQGQIRLLLIKCLEIHYGSLSNCISETGWAESRLMEIDAILSKDRAKLYGNN